VTLQPSAIPEHVAQLRVGCSDHAEHLAVLAKLVDPETATALAEASSALDRATSALRRAGKRLAETAG
jgi:hypothetical protein